MKRKLIFPILAFAFFSLSMQSDTNFWNVLADVRFESKFNNDVQTNILYPYFGKTLKSYEEKTVKLTGYFMPIDLTGYNFFILSKYPYSQCYFCGQAGTETIIAIYPKDKKVSKAMKGDDIVTVKGRLVLNNTNIDELNYMLKDAEVLSVQ